MNIHSIKSLFKIGLSEKTYTENKTFSISYLNDQGMQISIFSEGDTYTEALISICKKVIKVNFFGEINKENAVQAMSDTSSSWEERCHSIMNSLGVDFGGYTEKVPDKFVGNDIALVIPYLKNMMERGDEEAGVLYKMVVKK